MTNREIAELLKSLGYDVKYRERKDGGILITKIDGTSFSGAKGNAKAREMAGVLGFKNTTLSAKRAKQLKMIKPKKRQGVKKLEAVPEDVRSKIKDLQKKYKKTSDITKRDAGSVGIRHYRYMKKKYGDREARAYLERAERYIEGYAYSENIQSLILRINMDADSLPTQYGDKLRSVSEALEMANRDGYIKTETINHIVELLYDFEKDYGTVKTEQELNTLVNIFTNRAKTLIKLGYVSK